MIPLMRAPLLKPKNYAEWLRLRRQQRQITQLHLANLSGVDRTYINRIEKGHIDLPTYETRIKLHSFLKTSEQELIDLGIIPGVPSPEGDTSYAESEADTIFGRATKKERDEWKALRNRIHYVLSRVKWDEERGYIVLNLLENFIEYDRLKMTGSSIDLTTLPDGIKEGRPPAMRNDITEFSE